MIRDKLLAQRSIEPNGFRWRSGEITRLEAFSDAVFAFALALLVVSVDVPKTFNELMSILLDFPSFGATFAVLVWLWYLHYIYFRRYGFSDALTTFYNAVLLFLILFYVYPLKYLFSALLRGFIGEGWSFSFEQGRMLMTVYSAGFVSVFLMLALLYWHALRKKVELELNTLEILMTQANMKANLLLVGIGAFSASLAWFGAPWMVPVAGFLYSAIGPLMWWHWLRVDKQRKKLKIIM